ncbi:hypothetical protein [Polymorphospora rubra]|uniref:Uncharacterized protein n=1 Tax=Polymorphospora rubra TaxID=338584 RepID=A0A810N7G3_9ACTN|nr:hypothetical protein [Polymorphospora rubra]BCJ69197.1 hypothetical protein Prubr_62180 [Polymorphospora rubra]
MDSGPGGSRLAGTTSDTRRPWNDRPATPPRPAVPVDPTRTGGGQVRVNPLPVRPAHPAWAPSPAPTAASRPLPPPAQRNAATAPPGSIEPPPDHLLPILAQLMTGATDVTASQRLGMSPRTFSRRVSELLDHLGVLSRFQAGVASANQGWVLPRQQPTARNH